MAAEDYVGPVGHEKKFHKTHFSTIGVKLKGNSPNTWVQIAPGRFKLVRKVEKHVSKEKES